LIAQEARLETIIKWVKEQEYPTLLKCGLELAEREESSLEEIARVALFD